MADFLGAQGSNFNGPMSSTNSVADNSQNRPLSQPTGLAQTPLTLSEDAQRAPPSISSISSNEHRPASLNPSNNLDPAVNRPERMANPSSSGSASSTVPPPAGPSLSSRTLSCLVTPSLAGSTSSTTSPPVGPSPSDLVNSSSSTTSPPVGPSASSNTPSDLVNSSSSTILPPVGPSPSSSTPNNANSSHSPMLNSSDHSASTSGHVDDNTAEPVRKKKRSEMGPAERQLARQESANRSKKLGAAIGDLLEEQEALFAKTAEDHNVSAARIKRLANQAPALKPKKKASDYNILFFYKNKELNGDRPPGSKLSSKLIHDAVQKDDELQEIRNNESSMAELRKRYMEDKDDDDVATVRISKRREAKTVASQVSAFQQSPIADPGIQKLPKKEIFDDDVIL
ncbi:hypothetical protein C8R42DRAFT_644623 [Lentinula raphanica]|nr:hypothetical protein C8R42DRAFT_644623 [Lentinula raphanica]